MRALDATHVRYMILDEKIKDWIKKEGYPLEFSVAHDFKKRGFSVEQSHFVKDSEGKIREVDVLATQNILVGNSILRILHVVECKWSKDKPWILFADEKRYASTALAAQLTPQLAKRYAGQPLVTMKLSH